MRRNRKMIGIRFQNIRRCQHDNCHLLFFHMYFLFNNSDLAEKLHLAERAESGTGAFVPSEERPIGSAGPDSRY